VTNRPIPKEHENNVLTIFLLFQIQIKQPHQINQPQRQIGGSRHSALEHMECYNHILQQQEEFHDHLRVD
jgi:hypothetical protein